MFDNEKYGARFLVISAAGRIVPKEKFFASAAARSRYLGNLSDAGKLHMVTAYLDPKNEEAVKNGKVLS